MKTAKCRSCGADILWATTENEKFIPLDAAPSEKGNILLLPDDPGPVTQYASKGHIEELKKAGKPLYLSHFVTCPNAKSHRKEKPS